MRRLGVDYKHFPVREDRHSRARLRLSSEISVYIKRFRSTARVDKRLCGVCSMVPSVPVADTSGLLTENSGIPVVDPVGFA